MNTIYRLAMILLITVGSLYGTFAQKLMMFFFIQSYSRSNNWVGELNEGLKRLALMNAMWKWTSQQNFWFAQLVWGKREMRWYGAFVSEPIKQNYDLIITANLYKRIGPARLWRILLPRKVPVMFFSMWFIPIRKFVITLTYTVRGAQPFHRLQKSKCSSETNDIGERCQFSWDKNRLRVWCAVERLLQSNPDYKLSRFKYQWWSDN